MISCEERIVDPQRNLRMVFAGEWPLYGGTLHPAVVGILEGGVTSREALGGCRLVIGMYMEGEQLQWLFEIPLGGDDIVSDWIARNLLYEDPTTGRLLWSRMPVGVVPAAYGTPPALADYYAQYQGVPIGILFPRVWHNSGDGEPADAVVIFSLTLAEVQQLLVLLRRLPDKKLRWFLKRWHPEEDAYAFSMWATDRVPFWRGRPQVRPYPTIIRRDQQW